MLPQTKQATSTEVEGETTVDVTGVDGFGQALQPDPVEPENQTAAPQAGEAEGESQGTEPTLPEKAPRQERRMEKLIDNLKGRTDEVSELRKQLDSLRAKPQTEDTALPPWAGQTPVPQGEITLDEYRAQVADTARNLVKSELSGYQQKVLQYTDFKDDLAYVESKYPILNKDSDSYEPEKVKVITDLYSRTSKADPSTRLKDIVEGIMSFHQAGQEVGKKEMTVSVVKRQAEAAVTPSPKSVEAQSESSDWESMSLKEKEAWMKAQGIWDQ